MTSSDLCRQGLLIQSDPEDGCGPVAPPPAVSRHHHWLLLIRDGNCSSGDKVLHAQHAGYEAAIVYNQTGDGFRTCRHPGVGGCSTCLAKCGPMNCAEFGYWSGRYAMFHTYASYRQTHN